VRGTKLHAEAAGLAALDDDRNTSFCHESPQFVLPRNSTAEDVIMGPRNVLGCDGSHGTW
jgi:hypothetical protein